MTFIINLVTVHFYFLFVSESFSTHTVTVNRDSVKISDSQWQNSKTNGLFEDVAIELYKDVSDGLCKV